MPTSRRSLLRNSVFLAGDAAVGGVMGRFVTTSLPSKAPSQDPSPAGLAAPFDKGVRVFFAGAWLFCPWKDNGVLKILAIARAMDASMPHYFLSGPWSATLDTSTTSLQGNNTSTANPTLAPHTVSITDSKGASYPTPAMADALAVFQSAVDRNPCTYLPSTSTSKVTVDLTADRLRIISLPFPQIITPATYRSWAHINAPAGLLAAPTAGSAPYTTFGVPTVNVFSYPGDDWQLSFAGQDDLGKPINANSTKSATDSSGDFHFHVMPKDSNAPDHGPMMFDQLVQIMKVQNNPIQGLTMIVPSGGVTQGNLDLTRGPDIPLNTSTNYVSDAEIGTDKPLNGGAHHISHKKPGIAPKAPLPPLRMTLDKASCTGGGILTGGCPDGSC